MNYGSFYPLSAPPDKLETDWSEDCDKVTLRRCPLCECDLKGLENRRHEAMSTESRNRRIASQVEARSTGFPKSLHGFGCPCPQDLQVGAASH
jgi:hypothetical protein